MMGKRTWTDKQICTLRDEFSKGTSIKTCAEILGKSLFSVKAYASRHDIPHASYSPWTTKEDRILREIWTSPVSIKEGLRRLPGRTYDAVRVRAEMRLNLGSKTPAKKGSKSFVMARIRSLIEKNGPMTVDEMAKESGMPRKGIQSILKSNRGTEAHIVGWKRIDSNHHAALFDLGAGEDAPRPAPKTPDKYWTTYKQKKNISTGKINPFEVAAGLVKPTDSAAGHVYSQDMTIHLHDEWEAA
ncbi:hypothetical protein ACW910_24240 (plasmid) [Burkholderia ambifaria]